MLLRRYLLKSRESSIKKVESFINLIKIRKKKTGRNLEIGINIRTEEDLDPVIDTGIDQDHLIDVERRLEIDTMIEIDTVIDIMIDLTLKINTETDLETDHMIETNIINMIDVDMTIKKTIIDDHYKINHINTHVQMT